ncbi:MAG: Grx4 family monothiol glutaredoxin [Gammaproteobacteria bacterium]|nr:Grx4 family monothiol glutaredoxin [Gammaproteobacteria bacterium]
MNTRIEETLKSHPVLLFMKGSPDFPQCGFSGRATQILQACGMSDFQHINILEDPEIREGLKVYSNWPTFPQLYVNGELVGGCDIMMEQFESGELKKILDTVGQS